LIRGEWGGDDPDFGAAGLSELQSEEIALALAHLDCCEAHLQAVYEPLCHKLEHGLFDEHGDKLTSIRVTE